MIFGSHFLASQSLQTLMCEEDRRVMLALRVHVLLPHSHYRNWCAQREGDLFAFVLPFPPVFHLHTSFRYTNSNPLFPHGHYRTWCARSNDGCRMRVSLCAAPLWMWLVRWSTIESYAASKLPFHTTLARRPPRVLLPSKRALRYDFPITQASIHPQQNAKFSNLFNSQTYSPLAPNPLPADSITNLSLQLNSQENTTPHMPS